MVSDFLDEFSELNNMSTTCRIAIDALSSCYGCWASLFCPRSSHAIQAKVLHDRIVTFGDLSFEKKDKLKVIFTDCKDYFEKNSVEENDGFYRVSKKVFDSDAFKSLFPDLLLNDSEREGLLRLPD